MAVTKLTRGNGRGPGGRFAEGNAGGPGRPSKAEELLRPLRLLRVVEAEVSDGDVLTIVRTAKRQAMDGKPQARAWLTPLLLERFQLAALADAAGFTRSLMETLDKVDALEARARTEGP